MIEVGDRVQARKIVKQENAPDDVVVSEFTVTAVSGKKYSGSPIGVIEDGVDGWSVELARKDPANLHLPESLSEISAHLYTGFDVALIGRGTTWRNHAGSLVPIDQILSWDPISA